MEKTVTDEERKVNLLKEACALLGLDFEEVRRAPLKGIWKGVEITDEDIEEAKRPVFRMDLGDD